MYILQQMCCSVLHEKKWGGEFSLLYMITCYHPLQCQPNTDTLSPLIVPEVNLLQTSKVPTMSITLSTTHPLDPVWCHLGSMAVWSLCIICALRSIQINTKDDKRLHGFGHERPKRRMPRNQINTILICFCVFETGKGPSAKDWQVRIRLWWLPLRSRGLL